MLFRKLSLGCSLAILLLTTGILAPRDANALELAEMPLFMTAAVDPNILFILDDSGSMMFETTPDQMAQPSGATPYGAFMFPRADGVYGDDDYGWNTLSVATVDHESAFNAMNRSPQFNATYYNPGVTYHPWTRADGSLFPPADPQCALHNPMRTGTSNQRCRNLTQTNYRYDNSTRWVECNPDGSGGIDCSWSTGNKSFWPATYFWHEVAASDENSSWEDRDWNWDNYTSVRIDPDNAPFSGHGRTARTDCSGGSCTYQQEIQNFANWYTYYRSRILATRAGVGQAFAGQADRMRVGFGAINKGSSTIDGQSTGTIISGVRPFEGANRENFYERLYEHAIPALGTPLRKALDDAGQYYSRTDSRGPWSSTPGESGGVDLSCRQSYTIMMTDGYWVGGSDTAANTAGARANVDGNSGPLIAGPGEQSFQYTASDPYQDGQSNTLADVAMYYWNRDLRPDLDNQLPPSDLNPAFWQHMVTFGVSLGVSGSIEPDWAWSQVESGEPINWPSVNASSAGNCSGAVCAARLDDLLHAAINSRGGFFSAMDPQQFATDMAETVRSIIARAGATFGVTTSGAVLLEGNLAFRTEADAVDWTGNVYAVSNPDTDSETIHWNAQDTLPSHNDRRLFTQGERFTTNHLGSGLLQRIHSDEAVAREIVSYTRGDESLHELSGGTYQDRSTPIGAIVGAQPVIQRQVNFAWGRLSEDYGGDDYEEFVDDKEDQPAVIYVGSNAGVLHAFNANNGQELFGYVPLGVFENLKDVADPNIPFRYTVDGSHVVADAYDGSNWKTVLVGSLGAGGKSIFALDVTNPGTFSESNVLWEVEAQDLDDSDQLGYTFAQPQVARLSDGTWAVVVGNGYGSGDHKARLLVFNLFTGALIGNIQAGSAGTEGHPNGLSTPRVARERTAELWDRWVYAGDLHGNLWRFDLDTLSSTSEVTTPLFSGNRPITSQPQTSYPPRGRGFIVSFGTGKYLELSDNAATESSPDEYFYLIQDANPWGSPPNLRIGNLENRSFDGDTTDQEEDINFGNKDGWYVKLENGARLLSQPRILQGNVLFSSFKPSVDECQGGGDNDTYLMNVRSGTGAFAVSSLDDNTAVVRGIQGAPASPSFVVREITVPGSGVPGGPGSDDITLPQICVIVGEESICLDDVEFGDLAADLRDGRRTNWIQLK